MGVRVLRKPGAEELERAREWIRRRMPHRPVRAAVVPVEIEAPASEVAAGFRVAGTTLGALAVVGGYHVLLGWIFDIPRLRGPGVGPATTASEAFAAVLAGAALCALRDPRPSPPAQSFAAICASGVTALGLFALVEHLVAAGMGAVEGLGAVAPASMALTSAIAFLLLGKALLLVELRRVGLAQRLALLPGAIALEALAAYLYDAMPFAGQMPVYTSFGTMFLALGVLFVRADQGFMAKVTSDSFGGVMARRLLPATLLAPIALGWLRLQGHRASLFGSEEGIVLLALGNVVVFTTLVWWSVSFLYRLDGQRRLAESELSETASKLERSNADLEQFAYVTSHDLKEPLRAISGSVQVLQDRLHGTLDPEAEEFIHHTVDGANRMQTLIDDLLTYSRLTTREAPLEPTDCGAVLEEALENLAVSIAEARAVVSTDPLPTVPADRVQLLQVFQNLISNALKYRSVRTPKIHVSAEDRGHEWALAVRDNGVGIAPQYADRIFKIFQRLHTRKEYPGTGIGLAVCKKVIERHGGRIWVESEPEEGSTFFFTLPK